MVINNPHSLFLSLSLSLSLSLQLLDLFPVEGGSKNKKQRVIPFLPGKKWGIGKSNRELAERRLQDMAKYTQ